MVKTPTPTQLLANYPNPFNSEIWMPFDLSQDMDVTVSIYYDVQGHASRATETGLVMAGVM